MIPARAKIPPIPPREPSRLKSSNDQDFVWNRTDSVSVRQAKYERALAAQGQTAFAPFSPQAWQEFYIPDMCRTWPAPDRFTPAVPRGATVTGVPTLILAGDLLAADSSRALLDAVPRCDVPTGGRSRKSRRWGAASVPAIFCKASWPTRTPPSGGVRRRHTSLRRFPSSRVSPLKRPRRHRWQGMPPLGWTGG